MNDFPKRVRIEGIKVRLNFSSQEYYSMINWDDAIIHEPAATLLLSESNLHEIIKTGFKMNIAKFPCHSQAAQ